MSHIDDETLALHALGEDVLGDGQRSHLRDCPQCAGAAAELGGVARTVRTRLGTAATTTDLVEPPPAVWSRVATELGLGPADAGPGAAPVTPPAAPDAPALRSLPGGAEPVHGDRTSPSDDDLSARRAGRAWPRVLVAASLALVLGLAAGAVWGRLGVERSTGATIASATLDPLPGRQDATGTAEVHEGADGDREIVVSVEAPGADDTYREVWLLRPDASGLISLGVLTGTEGRFDLPEGLDLADYPVVDVSEEHFDGDPAHSGESVVRGALPL